MPSNFTRQKASFSIILILCVLGTILGLKYLLPLFLPFLFSFWIARLCSRMVRFIQKWVPLSQKTAVFLCLMILLCGVLIFLCWFFYTFYQQTKDLVLHYPKLLSECAQGGRSICQHCDRLLHLDSGTSYSFLSAQMESSMRQLETSILSIAARCSISLIRILAKSGLILFLSFLGAWLIMTDSGRLQKDYRSCPLFRDIHRILKKLSMTGIAYLKMECIVTFFVFLILCCGFSLLTNPYALLLGICIAVIDALPILGSGIVLIPWGIFSLLRGRLSTGITLLLLCFSCWLIRQYLEPRLLGKNLGVPSLYMLTAVYAGLKIYGITGILLGPLTIILILFLCQEYTGWDTGQSL
ncbi:MAG: AI-2E family transporter [Clostridiales bacterium]|nr:AI-2E family transporter [Clostridiales bacterium]